MYIITSPAKILLSTNKKTGKNKYFPLNINHYRNAHFRTLHKAKKLYSELMRHKLKEIPELDKVSLSFFLLKSNRIKSDVNNVLTIVEKFFTDCLVENGILKDDNYLYLEETNFKLKGIYPELEDDIIEVYIKPLK